MDAVWDRINKNIEEVESTSEPVSFLKYRIDFENRFYQLKSFLLDKIRVNSDETVLSPIFRTQPHVRLLQITLSIFIEKINE